MTINDLHLPWSLQTSGLFAEVVNAFGDVILAIRSDGAKEFVELINTTMEEYARMKVNYAAVSTEAATRGQQYQEEVAKHAETHAQCRKLHVELAEIKKTMASLVHANNAFRKHALEIERLVNPVNPATDTASYPDVITGIKALVDKKKQDGFLAQDLNTARVMIDHLQKALRDCRNEAWRETARNRLFPPGPGAEPRMDVPMNGVSASMTWQELACLLSSALGIKKPEGIQLPHVAALADNLRKKHEALLHECGRLKSERDLAVQRLGFLLTHLPAVECETYAAYSDELGKPTMSFRYLQVGTCRPWDPRGSMERLLAALDKEIAERQKIENPNDHC